VIGTVGETVGPDADLHRGHVLLPRRREDPDGVLPAIGGEHQVVRFGDQRSGDARQVWDGAEVRVGRAVDHVDGVVRGVCHIEQSSPAMDGRVVEPTRLRARGKVNVADVFQRHALPVRPSRQF
jgi:hypothetical protein